MKEDLLTLFNLTKPQIIERDQAIAEALKAYSEKLPSVYVAGGSYSLQAGEVLANSIIAVQQVETAPELSLA